MAKDRFDPTPLPPARPPSLEMRVKPPRPRGRGFVVKLVLFLLLGMSVGAVFVAKLLEGHADLEEQLERFFPAPRFQTGKPLAFDHAHQRVPDQGVIVDDEAAGRFGTTRSVAWDRSAHKG